MAEVRTRFAPSPTGYLHIGGVRTALFNWLFARRHGGRFILRIDDTDQQRNVEKALAPILHGFRWLGIDWDEGPEAGGEFGPYFQSRRQARYQAAVAELTQRGAAYADYATAEDLQAERAAAQSRKERFIYSRRWLAEDPEQRHRFESEGRTAVVRLKMPREGSCRFTDRIRGPVKFEWSQEQDHVVQRADGSCLYHLASVVDDHDMRISHVIRAEEHLSNTPRQIFIARSLGFPLPEYAHLPYVAEPGSKTKLSKRKLDKYLKNPDFARLNEHGQRIAAAIGIEVSSETFNPVIVDFYERIGFLPEALVNYLLLLGWALDDKTEEFTRQEMIEHFSLERVNKAPASFDPKKLSAFQSRHMQAADSERKLDLVLPYLERAGWVTAPVPAAVRAMVGRIVEAAGDRIEVAGDILDYPYFFVPDGHLTYDERAFDKRIRRPPEAGRLLGRYRGELAGQGTFDPETLERHLRRFVESEGTAIGKIIHALRVALTGQAVGFGLYETLAILGRERCLARLDRVLERLGMAPGDPPDPDNPGPDAGKGEAACGTQSERPGRAPHFIENIIAEDLRTGKYEGRVHTRFPPEPNGYLHIGHAKSICLNFGLAGKYPGALCNLRFDDTNPIKEEQEYVDAIKEDVRWLGFDWEDREFYASDYFDQLHQWAVKLIEKGKAYVDDLSADEIREYRGTLTERGRESPYRNRSVEENLDLFERMRRGEFPDGSRVLRAKIDMASGNLNMRDPVMYRILRATHHRTGDKWCIYPMYDWAHGQSDSIEGITHSLCTLEFEDHRPLYDWFLVQLGVYRPRQIEFARLNLSHTVMSKRKLLRMVEEGAVSGWDDPRMPTISGLRRRGCTPEAIRNFCDRVGVAKVNSVVDIALLEHAVREDLNLRAQRVMAVLRPLRVVLDNYPGDQTDELDAVNNPENPAAGTRKVPFSRVLYIERDDFREDPPRKYFRLAPGREVRLRYGYFIRCVDVVKDEAGEVIELRCTYDPATRGGSAPDGRKVKGTIHWVSAQHALPATVRLYDHLLTRADPDDVQDDGDFLASLNPDSVEVVSGSRVEPFLGAAAPGSRYQFERLGYFCVDPVDSTADRLVFNRTVTLRDTWAKIERAMRQGGRGQAVPGTSPTSS
jgi:glutaminyl-tRNA synthetase